MITVSKLIFKTDMISSLKNVLGKGRSRRNLSARKYESTSGSYINDDLACFSHQVGLNFTLRVVTLPGPEDYFPRHFIFIEKDKRDLGTFHFWRERLKVS